MLVISTPLQPSCKVKAPREGTYLLSSVVNSVVNYGFSNTYDPIQDGRHYLNRPINPLGRSHQHGEGNPLNFRKLLQCHMIGWQIYCQILRRDFWVFLFRQSSAWGRGYANQSQRKSPACDSY